MDAALERLLHPVIVLRAFYFAASALILVIQAVPALQNRFLAYGSRATSPSEKASLKPERRPTAIEKLLDYAASLQVPHNYFTHFYVVSVASSIFWSVHVKLWKDNDILWIVWALMLLQGVRRLLESYAYTSSSKSKMWFGHWILGLVFYLATNAAIWVEQGPNPMTPRHPYLSGPNAVRWKTAILVPAILTAHVLQHTYHAYLYQLRTQNAGYQLPSHTLFPNLICPHYTCEIAIYALLSFLAAPPGKVVNWTLVSATVFVVVNLGVTAAGTKEWYMKKFGVEKVSGRRRMIPWIW